MTQQPTGSDALAYAATDGDVGVPVLQFLSPDKAFKLFRPEAAVDGDDLVFHFFLPEDLTVFRSNSSIRKFWDDVFPEALDPVARGHFLAEYPRIRAQHVQEFGIDSWWLRASGFGASVVDLDRFVNKFYDRLEEALSSKAI